jgi:DNA-directed RNA polymerase specialized sigma24 family protein
MSHGRQWMELRTRMIAVARHRGVSTDVAADVVHSAILRYLEAIRQQGGIKVTLYANI